MLSGRREDRKSFGGRLRTFPAHEGTSIAHVNSPSIHVNTTGEFPSHQKPSKGEFRYKQSILFVFIGFTLGNLILGEKLLALVFAFVGGLLPSLLQKRRKDRNQALLGKLWPELLDHMISGLRSGLSIAETLSGLATRGPEVSRPIFKECQSQLTSGNDIGLVFDFIKTSFNDPIADQVCEVLDFARSTGSRDTAITLRTLGDFIRSDISVRGEIEAKLSWVKNSALVAAIAPWILLLILSSQPSTVQAFATSTGILILLTGVFMCALAYFWMSRVGRVQMVPRIFLTKGRS